ncbi:hypothetical protein GOZ78_11035 [Agrobacterium vitis]|uniref:Serine protease n=1 Tax=Agrobacterium vitis TaxID=373 RepID=A0ABD6GD93_AGRVI|nr:hypothetical protein [Agrobacterium vitis]MUO81195.1 hypothetical protein [Agrobacterium vitis]MUO95647.1 hypothetical protein [Agrobacterium vitis]MUP06876.1 hypothetical protein [Agrobacterium vitis]MUZ84656.1 hypothetical protein [Agrobacterium vitis]MVA10565.1 hypothetical protein [Agrobacterium vitis]
MSPSFRHLMLALAGAMTAMPAPLLANDKVTCWGLNTKELAVAPADYWTEERMHKAISEPLELPSDQKGSGSASPQALGDAERAPINEAPYKFGGKLFYTRGGKDYKASAQFVAQDNIVIGAAHSLWYGGKEATNIRFMQGYNGGGGTRYDIDQAAVLTEWTKVAGEDPSAKKSQYDYSVMRTKTASAVGRYDLGTAKVNAAVTITGYPGRLEDGNYMYREGATILAQAGTSFEARPHPMSGGGASGGAWFIGDSGSFKAVSVVASGTSDYVRGPVFTDDTTDMIAYVKGGCK